MISAYHLEIVHVPSTNLTRFGLVLDFCRGLLEIKNGSCVFFSLRAVEEREVRAEAYLFWGGGFDLELYGNERTRISMSE